MLSNFKDSGYSVWIALIVIYHYVAHINAACNFWNTLKVGFVHTSQFGISTSTSNNALIVNGMFQRYVNTDEYCGLAHMGIKLEIITMDAKNAANATLIIEVAKNLISQNVSVIFPGSQTVGIQIANIVDPYNIPMISTMTGNNGLFFNPVNPSLRRYKNMFVVTNPSRAIFSRIIPFVAAKGFKKVAILTAPSQPDIDVCGGAVPYIEEHLMEIVYNKPISVVVPDANTNMDQETKKIETALLDAMSQKPDLVLSCLLNYCDSLFSMLEKHQITPTAHANFACATRVDVMSKYKKIAQYTFAAAHWDERVIGQDYQDVYGRKFGNMYAFPPNSTKKSPMEFYNDFMKPINNPNQIPCADLAAVHLNGLYVIERAVYRSNSTDPLILQSHIDHTTMTSVNGRIALDDIGMNYGSGMIFKQILDIDGSTAIVIPPLNSPILPVPSMEQRYYNHQPGETKLEIAIIIMMALLTIIPARYGFMNYQYRHHPAIKALSVRFSYMIVAGIIILLWAPSTWLYYNSESMCSMRIWVWMFGFVFIMCPIAVTTCRLYLIISSETTKVKKLPDWKMFLWSLVLIGPAFIICLAWSLLAPMEVHMVVIDEYRPALNYRDCKSKNNDWIVVTAVFVVIVLLIVSALAFRVRNFSSRYNQFNNAKKLGMIVFTLIGTLVIVIVTELNNNDRNTQLGIRSFCAMLVAIATSILYFFDAHEAITSGDQNIIAFDDTSNTTRNHETYVVKPTQTHQSANKTLDIGNKDAHSALPTKTETKLFVSRSPT